MSPAASSSSSTRVPISTHSLNLTIHPGPPGAPASTPAVLILQGLASDSYMWSAAIRHITTITQVYSYSRSGYGDSDPSPNPPTASTIALELSDLLASARITGPWILLAHSWGGIHTREFLDLRRKDVVGVVLVDANQETTIERLDWRDPCIWAVVGVEESRDRAWCERIMGIPGRHKLSDEEYALHLAATTSAAHERQGQAEHAEYAASFETLQRKPHLLLSHQPPLLGDAPVAVVKGDNRRDFQCLYEYGVARGHGAEHERGVFRNYLETWDQRDGELQREQLKLSTRGRYVEVKGSGHDVQMTAPEALAEAVAWVLEEL
ncbi:MAG: alpha/beta fold hydrolase [Janthinobacterium lividum]